jgi:hypothetical protein
LNQLKCHTLPPSTHVQVHAENKLRLEAAWKEAEEYQAGAGERERRRVEAEEESRRKSLEAKISMREAEIDALPADQQPAARAKQAAEIARAKKVAAQEAERLALMGVR